MSNSLVNNLLHVLQGVHKDIIAAYPALEVDLSKDFERIARLVKERGLGVFTLDLPSLESALLRGLEEGRLILEGPLSQRVSKRIQVPVLYRGLWLRVFDNSACLKHEADVTAVAFLRQVLTLGKKIQVDCSPDRIQSVVGAYHDIEHGLRRPTLGWSGDDLGIGSGGNQSPFGDDGRGDFHLNGGYRLDFGDLHGSSALADEPLDHPVVDASKDRDPLSLHLVQARGPSLDDISSTLPLFHSQVVERQDEEIARHREDRWILTRIQHVADVIIGAFDELDPVLFSEYLEQHGKGIGFKHGPGAVAERLKQWEKSHFPNWPRKLQGTFPFESCGSTASDDRDRPLNHEVASRLISVPKTAKGPRLIAAEPTSHQWCQQLILRFLFDQCRRTFGTSFIDFRDQSKSGDMVLDASRDKSLATVDLSDASDRLTCWTVERMFRSSRSILTALHAARTRYLRDEISEDKGFLLLRKFASQGTATTFPVMSLVMLFIALGCSIQDDEHISMHTIRKYRNQVRVFGDDIILPTHGYGRLIRAMALLQLKVNVAKSYVSGYFRESCGTDGYKGYDVTPVKPKVLVADSPASCQAVVDNANNLFLKGYWNASQHCFELLPARLRRGIRIVGPNDAGYRGVFSYSGGYESHLAKRWNSRLHRFERRVWTLSVRTQEHPRDGFSALLDFFASKHNHEHARIVSQFADVRKTRIGLQWEPENPHARHNARSWEARLRSQRLLQR
jgi:hypothetical protein